MLLSAYRTKYVLHDDLCWFNSCHLDHAKKKNDYESHYDHLMNFEYRIVRKHSINIKNVRLVFTLIVMTKRSSVLILYFY
jgi:hypothetical protein